METFLEEVEIYFENTKLEEFSLRFFNSNGINLFYNKLKNLSSREFLRNYFPNSCYTQIRRMLPLNKIFFRLNDVVIFLCSFFIFFVLEIFNFENFFDH